MRKDSTLFDLMERWEAACFLIRIAGGPLPAPEPNAFGHPSKAGSQLVWLGLAYRLRTTPPTYMINQRGKDTLQLLNRVLDALQPLAKHRPYGRRNEIAGATCEQLERLLSLAINPAGPPP